MATRVGFCKYPRCKNKYKVVELIWFPTSRERQLKWIEALDVKEWQNHTQAALSRYQICGDHFEVKYRVRRKGNLSVTTNAVPTATPLSPDESPFKKEMKMTLEGNARVVNGLVTRWRKAGREVRVLKVNDTLTIYRSPNPAKQPVRQSQSIPVTTPNTIPPTTTSLGQIPTDGQNRAETATTNTLGAPVLTSLPTLSVRSPLAEQIRLRMRSPNWNPPIRLLPMSNSPMPTLNSVLRPLRHSGPIRISATTPQTTLGVNQVSPGGSIALGRAPLQIRLPSQVIGSVHQLVLDPATGHLLLTQTQPKAVSQGSSPTLMNNVVNTGVTVRGGLTLVSRTDMSQPTSLPLTYTAPATPGPTRMIVKSNPVPYVPKTSGPVPTATATASDPAPTPSLPPPPTLEKNKEEFSPKIMSVTSLNRNSPQPEPKSQTIPSVEQTLQLPLRYAPAVQKEGRGLLYQEQRQRERELGPRRDQEIERQLDQRIYQRQQGTRAQYLQQAEKQESKRVGVSMSGPSCENNLALKNGLPLANPSSAGSRPQNLIAAPRRVEQLVISRHRPITNAPSSNEDPCKGSYPSLVVNIRPSLKVPLPKQVLASSRFNLDETVKELINMDTAKFVEWLLRKGLLRVDLKCDIHTPEQGNVFKLGKYNNQVNEPFSGGYIWVAECCLGKQVSVFYGSIFEGSTFTPHTLLKLIYHWACQTSPRNVCEWVKVSPYFLKNFYTLLRSVCIAGVHQYLYQLGGKDKSIQVGIVKIQSTKPGASSKKISVLAAYDPVAKDIRFRIVKQKKHDFPPGFPQSDIDMQNRIDIFGPLKFMVDRDSDLLIDKTMSASTFRKIGFRGQVRNTTDVPDVSPNVTVMEYLRQVVPKAFSATLNMLSDPLIQQFLDEMSWREKWGETSELAFNTIMDQLVHMTRNRATCFNLLARLNDISFKPFENCAWDPLKSHLTPEQAKALSEQTQVVMLKARNPNPSVFRPVTLANGLEIRQSRIPAVNQVVVPSSAVAVTNPNPSPVAPPLPALFRIEKPTMTLTPSPLTQGVKRKAETFISPSPTPAIDFELYYANQEKSVGLQSYYYAEANSTSAVHKFEDKLPRNLKCAMCSMLFECNEDIIMHFVVHVKSMGMKGKNNHGFCKYCFKDVGQGIAMESHVLEDHKLTMGVKKIGCLICQEPFSTEKAFTLHMWKNHGRQDMPYRCGVCDYRSSYHWEVVDHFYAEHNRLAVVQCPICLKVLPCKSFNCLKFIIVHVQTHVLKKGRQCNQCILSLTTDTDLRSHLVEMSHSDDFVTAGGDTAIPLEIPSGVTETKMAVPPKQRRHYDKVVIPNKIPKLTAKPQLHPSTSPQNPSGVNNSGLNVPKLTQSRSPPRFIAGTSNKTCPPAPGTRAPPTTQSSGVVYKDEGSKYTRDSTNTVEVVDYNLQRTICLECNEHAASPAHYPGALKCNLCQYFTSCCRKSMKNHQKLVHSLPDTIDLCGSVISENTKRYRKLKKPVYCTCGYSSSNGFDMSYHLDSCSSNATKTAYPPKDALQDNSQEIISTDDKDKK